jgi:hypothetical protein
LEFDHRKGRAAGGSGESENAQIYCRPHNLLKAEIAFGREYVESKIRERRDAVAVGAERSDGDMRCDGDAHDTVCDVQVGAERSGSDANAERRDGDARCDSERRSARGEVAAHARGCTDGGIHRRQQRFVAASNGLSRSAARAAHASRAPLHGPCEKLFQALTTMGFKQAETRNAIAKLQVEAPDTPLEVLLRRALAMLTP